MPARHLPRLALMLGLLLAAAWPGPAGAQAWPERPVTIIVPFGAGNGADLITRLLAPRLTQAWGEPVVVQNIPGASGAIGVERTVRSAPDGHTLVMSGDAALVVRTSMVPPLPYDPRRDLAPVTLVARTPNLLVVPAQGGPHSLAELVAAARAAGGGFSYGHLGPGTSVQVGAELLKQMAGVEATGVGYPSIGALMQDVVAGRLQLAFATAVAAAPLVQEGRLRALAISSAARLASFPQVPTVAEQGYPGFEASAWFGLLAPAATPAPVVARIRADVTAALGEAELRGRLDALGAVLVGNTPAEFAALIHAEIPRMAGVLQKAGITGQ